MRNLPEDALFTDKLVEIIPPGETNSVAGSNFSGLRNLPEDARFTDKLVEIMVRLQKNFDRMRRLPGFKNADSELENLAMGFLAGGSGRADMDLAAALAHLSTPQRETLKEQFRRWRDGEQNAISPRSTLPPLPENEIAELLFRNEFDGPGGATSSSQGAPNSAGGREQGPMMGYRGGATSSSSGAGSSGADHHRAAVMVPGSAVVSWTRDGEHKAAKTTKRTKRNANGEVEIIEESKTEEADRWHDESRRGAPAQKAGGFFPQSKRGRSSNPQAPVAAPAARPPSQAPIPPKPPAIKSLAKMLLEEETPLPPNSSAKWGPLVDERDAEKRRREEARVVGLSGGAAFAAHGNSADRPPVNPAAAREPLMFWASSSGSSEGEAGQHLLSSSSEGLRRVLETAKRWREESGAEEGLLLEAGGLRNTGGTRAPVLRTDASVGAILSDAGILSDDQLGRQLASFRFGGREGPGGGIPPAAARSRGSRGSSSGRGMHDRGGASSSREKAVE